MISLKFCYAQNPADSASIKKDSLKQQSDTTKIKQIISDIKDTKVSKQLVKTITKRPSGNPGSAMRSEEVFMPYEGKIIRSIIITHLGFERSITDTTKRLKTTISKLANKVHTDSKAWLIKDNLFIREKRPLNPYKMADNERYLRDLDFILDARFYVIPLSNTEDSVDVIVITRDVFSIGGSFNPSSPTATKFKVYDINVLGAGQRIQFNGLIDDDRSPTFGHELIYRKNSIGGSFISGTAAFTQLNTGSSYGGEQEKAYYLKLERPLVSPYTKMAGGMELSRNWSKNFYNSIDTIFRNYAYLVNDIWIGYNLGAGSNMHDRNRHFIAVRAFDQHFIRKPTQRNEETNPLYNNRTYVLGAITFFKQNFYTARYIYGFGRTEDVPYGHNISLYIGWTKQLNLERPYFGFDASKSFVNSSGRFYNLSLKVGGYNNNGFQDGAMLISSSVSSRLITYKKLLIRQTIGGDVTQLIRQKTAFPLDINNELGLRGFSADSLWGTKRTHISSETIVFTPIKIFGFRIAPFTAADLAWLAKKHESYFGSKPYLGIGGGIRTRNENLVFGTVEFRVMYFPRMFGDISSLNLRVSSNLRVKYSGSFVRPPSFINYN